MKKKIMLGLAALGACLSLASCGESDAQRDNEMEETAFSMASAKCDEYFEKKTKEYFDNPIWKDSVGVIMNKQLITRDVEEKSSFYMWFMILTLGENKENTFSYWNMHFFAIASWDEKEVRIDECGGYDGQFYERYI